MKYQVLVDRKKLMGRMLDCHMNVKSLAEASGISRVTISNIRCGKTCSDETLAKIAVALKTEPGKLV
jgi:DNA-binding Xre family transcriptional regulator